MALMSGSLTFRKEYAIHYECWNNVLKKILTLNGINKHTIYGATQYGTSWFVQGNWYCLGSEALKDMMGMPCRLDGEIQE